MDQDLLIRGSKRVHAKLGICQDTSKVFWEGLFDKILKVFGLEAPCHYETDRTLAKKLHLKEIARGESTVKS